MHVDKYPEDNNSARLDICSYDCCREILNNVDICVKVTGASDVGHGPHVTVHVDKYAEDNYYARFDTCSYDCCRETFYNVD